MIALAMAALAGIMAVALLNVLPDESGVYIDPLECESTSYDSGYVCLDRGYNPINGLSDWVTYIEQDAMFLNHALQDCGLVGAYTVYNDGSGSGPGTLVIETPEIPRAGDYVFHFNYVIGTEGEDSEDFSLECGGRTYEFEDDVVSPERYRDVNVVCSFSEGNNQVVIRSTGNDDVSFERMRIYRCSECSRNVNLEKTSSPNTINDLDESAIILAIKGDECINPSVVPVDVMLVIDISGSMSGQKLVDAREAAKGFINNLDFDKHRVGIVAFYENATLIQPLTSNKGLALNRVDSLTYTRENTNLGEGIRKAKEEIQANGRSAEDGVVRVIVALTDGVTNRMNFPPIYCSGTSTYCPDWRTNCLRDVDREATLAKNDDMVIYTIGLGITELCSGDGANQGVLQEFIRSELRDEIATSTHYYYEAPTSEDLEEIYTDISDEVSNIVAKDLIVTDVLGEGIELAPGEVPDDCDYVEEEKRLVCELGTLSAGETKLLAFNIVPTRSGNIETNVLEVSRVDYEDYYGNTAEKPFPSNTLTVIPSFNPSKTFECESNSKFEYQMYPGWNLLSIPCVDIDVIQDDCGAKTGSFYSFDNKADRWVVNKKGMEAMKIGSSYWFYSKRRCTVNVTGQGDFSLDDITITHGWNSIGAPKDGIDYADVLSLRGLCEDCEQYGSPSGCKAYSILAYDTLGADWEFVDSLEQGRGYLYYCKT